MHSCLRRVSTGCRPVAFVPGAQWLREGDGTDKGRRDFLIRRTLARCAGWWRSRLSGRCGCKQKPITHGQPRVQSAAVNGCC